MNRVDQIAQMARPQLGDQIPLLVFRAFRHFSANYVEELLGRGSNMAFQNGGRELGREVGSTLIKPELDAYLSNVVEWVRDAKIGLLRAVELSDIRLVVALDECITCAGMPNIGKRICHFEVGLVAGVVETFVKRRVRASETKCNANGEATCEVTVDL
jgi:predicted hydrocarbon binding protein